MQVSKQENDVQQQYLTNLLRISNVLSDTNSLDNILLKLMDELLDVFQTDRTWLLYPCDPDTDFWNVPVEATRSGYPGAFASAENIPIDKGAADIFREALSSPTPVIYDFSEEDAPESIQKFNIKTQMVISISPANDKAWLMGMHQCSYHRKWSENDKQLFQEISTRVTEMLTQRLLLKRLEDELSLRKQMQQDLVRAKEEAETANKAKSEFLSMMSHELRTPLNAILGFSQLLEDEIKDKQQLSSIKEISKAGNHLLGLINEILNLSRIESGKLEIQIENCNMGTIIQDCVVLISSSAEKNSVKLINKIKPEDNYCVEADSLRLKQVLLNLISNAIKYNKKGGTVTLYCVEAGADLLKIMVSDTGAGLNDRDKESVFMPFERLHQHSDIEGTGIGLVITKVLVEMLNGQIGVESMPGHGSTFWLQFRKCSPAAR